MTDEPKPLDTAPVTVPDDLLPLTEFLAKHTPDASTRQAALEALKLLTAHGYRIVAPAAPAPPPATTPAAPAPPPATAPAEPAPRPAPTADVAAGPHELETRLAQLQNLQGQPHEFRLLLDMWSTRHAEPALWQHAPDLYRHLGQRLLALGAAPQAQEVARAALDHVVPLPDGRAHAPWAEDIELRQVYGLALARTANPEQAQQVLETLRAAGHSDEETLGMLASTWKDRALLATDATTRQQCWQQARGLYQEAYQRTGGYWTGVNLATLAKLGGDDQHARAVAQEVQEQCRAELARVGEQSADAYWPWATLGEAALVLGDIRDAGAGHFYRQAHQVAPHDFGNHLTTRRNARWLLQWSWHADAARLDRWLPMPTVVVFTGHMIDRPDRPRPRLPAQMAEAVKATIRTWLQEHHALIGYSSAACGADILFQEAVHELGGQTYVVLPYDAEQFVADSVDIVPGADWPGRFRQVLAHATQVMTASPEKIPTGSVSYDYANLVLHGQAMVQARRFETSVVGLAVWDGQPGDGPGGTASVVARWQSWKLPVHCIDVSALPDDPAKTLPILHPAPPSPASPSLAGPEADTRIMAMLFGDTVDFSKLTEEQVPRFVEHVLDPLKAIVERYGSANVLRNTWGDGLYFVFDTVHAAGCCALDIRDFVNDRVQSQSWTTLGLPASLILRLSLHAGPVVRCLDPLMERENYTGMHVSRAARLEPSTPPGEVYASEAFAALAAVERVTAFTCEHVQQPTWAQHYSTFPAYVVRRVPNGTHRGSASR